MEEGMELQDSNDQYSQQRFKTTSVCFKMKFDDFQGNAGDEKKFIVVHEMYQCGKCYKIFNEESTLSNHECSFRENGIAGTSGAQIVSAKKIKERKAKVYKYDCDQCDLSFTQQKILKKHRKTHKIKRIEFACTPCGLKFDSKDSLLQHRKSHYIEKWFRCDQCNKSFAYEKFLDLHVKKVHLTPKPPAQCNICEKIFSSNRNLARHRALHNLPGSKRFTCEICNVSFPLKAYLKNHSLVHSEEKPYMCEKCGKTFRCAARLKKHSYTHEYKPNASPNASRRGQKRGPRVLKPPHLYKYACDKCGRRFTAKYNLDIHYTIHTGERPHKCEVCSKAFRYKELLKNHMFTHSDLRHTCDKCDKQFASKGGFDKHLILHRDDEAIRCDVCDMKFSYQSALISHYVVHTKEKPYECELCHKRYSQKGSLNKHPCSRAAAKSTAEILLNLISRNENSP